MKKLIALFLLLLFQLPLSGYDTKPIEFDDFSSGTRYASDTIPNPSQVGTDQNRNHTSWWRTGIGIVVAGEYGFTGTGIGANLVTTSDRTASAAYENGTYIFFNSSGDASSGLTMTSSRYIQFADGGWGWVNLRLVMMRAGLHSNSGFVHNESMIENVIVDARNKNALLNTLSSGPTNGYVSTIFSSGIGQTEPRTDFYLGKEKMSLNGAALQYPSRAYYNYTSYYNSYAPGYASTADNGKTYDLPITFPKLPTLDATPPTLDSAALTGYVYNGGVYKWYRPGDLITSTMQFTDHGTGLMNVYAQVTGTTKYGNLEQRVKVDYLGGTGIDKGYNDSGVAFINTASGRNISDNGVTRKVEHTFKLPDSGWYSYFAQSLDYNYNWAGGSEWTGVSTGIGIGIDGVAPPAPTATLSRAGWGNTAATFTPTGGSDAHSGFNRYGYQINGGSWIGSQSTAITVSQEGQIPIGIVNIDNVENWSPATTKYVYNDFTAPTGSFNTTSGGWTNGGLSTIFNPADALSGVYAWWYTVYKNGAVLEQSYVLGDTNKTFNFSGTGVYRVETDVHDNAGNTKGYSTGDFSIDQAAPTVTASSTDYTWGNANKSITLAYGDTGGSGLSTKQYLVTTNTTTPTTGWLTYSAAISLATNSEYYIHYKATDYVGNTKTGYYGPYKIDKTAPTVTASSTDYTISKVDRSISLNYADSGGSGLSAKQYLVTTSTTSPTTGWLNYTAAINLTTDGKNYIHYKSTDNAGNVTIGYYGPYEIDKIAPGGFLNPSYSDWTNTEVTATFTPSDSGSGVKTWTYTTDIDGEVVEGRTEEGSVNGSASKSFIFKGTGLHHIDIFVYDNAGNRSYFSSGAYKIDTDVPTISISSTDYTWGQDKQITINYADTGDSGLNLKQYKITTDITQPTSGWSDYTSAINLTTNGIYYIHCKATDNAGNVAINSYGPYKIDKELPTITANPTNRNWLNTNISVTLNFTDLGSGININSKQYAWTTSTSVPTTWLTVPQNNIVTQSGDGIWYLHVKVQDNIGNSTTTYFGTYNKEVVLPVITANPINRAWSNQGISVTLSYSDTQSGINSATREYLWSLSATTPTTGWLPTPQNNIVTQSGDGIWYLHSRVTDNAGNIKTASFGTYNKETTPPAISANPINRAWSNQGISVALSYEDLESGLNNATKQYAWSLSNTTPTTWINVPANNIVEQTTDGIWYLHLKATDNAGNTKTTYYGTYNKETVLPSISPNPTSRNWSNQDISVTLSYSDSQSGINNATRQYAWSLSTTTPTTWTDVPVNNIVGQTSDGIWYLHLRVTDNAGNNKTSYYGTYNKDTVLPTINPNPVSRNWSNQDISVALGYSDMHSGINETTKQYAWSTSSAVPTIWTNTPVSNIVTQTSDGSWYLHLRVTDNAGNSKTSFYGVYFKEATPPVITANPINRDWLNTDISVSLTFNDTMSGINQSTRQYAWSSSTTVPTIWTAVPANNIVTQTTDGIWYLHSRVTDNAGNTQTNYFGTYKKETTPPVITASSSGSIWSNQTILVTLSYSDTQSGINNGTKEYVWSSSNVTPTTGWLALPVSSIVIQPLDGIWYLHSRVTDNAGNTQVNCFGTYSKETTPPAISANPINRVWSNQGISVTLSYSDTQSGINQATRLYAWSTSTTTPSTWATVPANNIVTQANDGIWYLHSKVTDNAGNTKTSYFGTYNKETVLPAITANPINRAWSNQGISVTLSYSDAQSGINNTTPKYVWSTSTATPSTGWTAVPANNIVTQSGSGIWYLYAMVTDNAGNTQTTRFGTYNMDTVLPTVTFTPNGRTYAYAYSVGVGITDSLSGIKSVKYAVNTSTTKPTSWVIGSTNFVVDLTLEGTYYIHVETEDIAGNIQYSRSNAFVLDNKAPTLNISYNPNPTMIQGVTTVNAQVFDFEKDSIQLKLELFDPNGLKQGEYIYASLIDSSLSTFAFTPTIPGQWVIKGSMVDLFESNRTNFTFNLPVLDGQIEGVVTHTDLWEENRQKFNAAKSGSIDSPRTHDYFFSGEMFVLSADVLNSDLVTSVKAKLKDSLFTVPLVRRSGNIWDGSLWDISMMGWKDRILDFEFIVEYQNGYKVSDFKRVYVNSDNFFRMKQTN